MPPDGEIPKLEWTGERYVPEVEGNIRLEHLHRYLIARELARGKRVLDIACGEGYGSDILATAASSVFGVDIAAEVVTHASLRYVRPNLVFMQGACDAIPLPDQSVDVVACFETIEHVDRHDETLGEIRRVLSPDGLLIISTPDRREYSDVLGNQNPYHVKELDWEEFDSLLKSHFENVSIIGQNIRGGSIVGPVGTATRTRFFTFAFDGTDQNPVRGLARPEFLVAFASGRKLPALPVGILDGGEFAWEQDVADRVSDLVRTVATLQEENKNQRLLAEYLEESGRRNRAELDALRVRAEELASALEEQNALADEKQNALADENELLRAQSASLQAATAKLQAEIQVFDTSRSWRLTAPLRRMAKNLRDARNGFQAAARSWRLVKPVPPSQPQSVIESAPPKYVPLMRTSAPETRIKLIAFYLPQFHPIPENDEWWGPGFTDWINVVRAKPQFPGHYQPHLPGDLGFYDLRLLENQRAQIELAKLYGIHGFCFHHYWFGGTKLLRRPLDQFLASPELDFPFCLCWANENWTRRWDGKDQEVLIGQQHSPDDDLAFIRDIEEALRDPRYIRVDGRPLLIVYRPALLPDPAATAERWRTYCRKVGIGELFLASTHAFDRQDPREIGFDAAIEFAPNNMHVVPMAPGTFPANEGFGGLVYDYRELVERSQQRDAEDYVLFRSVTPMWDNEARRPSNGRIFVNSSPARFRDWLKTACRWTEENLGGDMPFVFVNAWNEWAEGAHLEPDQQWGYAYLEATAEALEQSPIQPKRPPVVCVSHDAHFYGAQLTALNLAINLSTRLHYQVEMILCGPGSLTPEFAAVARVHDFSSPELTKESKSQVIRRLYEQGARIAVCNTSVVGETVELLKQAGFSVVSLIHELPQLIKSYALESSLALIAKHADRIVFAADLVRVRVGSVVDLPKDRTELLPQGLVAPNQFFGRKELARRALREQLGLSEQTRIVLGVGNADHRKGIDLFVDVGIRVIRSEEDVVFVWVGHQLDSAFWTARATVEKAEISHRFLFPGPIRNCDLFFAGSDAYLLTSREDPFPSVVMEALDAELPVIGFDGGGGFVELLQRGCGLLVPFEDTSAMAEALSRLLGSPEVGQQLCNVGREILAREFSFLNYTRELVEPDAPKVSVIVPSYNYARYLPQRLKSIIDQTYPPYEVLFLDDGSSDESVEIASEMLHASGLSYRIIANDETQGTYRQWLRGIREATGDLIWIAEADDDCAPNMVERLVGEFDREEVVIAYCQSRQIDEEGRELEPDYLGYTAELGDAKWCDRYVRPGVDEIRDSLAVKNTIPNVSAVLFRKGDLSAIESKLLKLRHAGDWLVYVHLLEQGSIAFVPDSLNYHRRHAAGVTIGGNPIKLMREILLLQEYIRERYGLANGTQERCQTSLQKTYEYLGLHHEGPASYKDHEDLMVLDWDADDSGPGDGRPRLRTLSQDRS